ncbi:MAG: hypothetical protein LBJ42_00250, partial [Holosporales bacterium]|nr:hypothetical protein [Holosporales bacterium]
MNIYVDRYSTKSLINDVIAGARILLLTTPIALAIAFACGVSPMHGLLSVGIAAACNAVLGGSKYQVSSIALSVMIPIIELQAKYQYKGLLVTSILVAIILATLGTLRMSDTMRHVTRTFLAAITTYTLLLVVISQLQFIIGTEAVPAIHGFKEGCAALYASFKNLDTQGLKTVLTYLAPMIILKAVMRGSTPYAIYIGGCAIIAYLVSERILPELIEIKTIGSKLLDMGAYENIATIAKTVPKQTALADALTYAFAIAIVIGTKTCIATNVAASVTGDRKIQYNAELIATGVANFASAACGGLLVAPDITYSLANISYKSKTVTSVIVVAALAICAVLYGGDALRYAPIYCMPGILIVYAVTALAKARLTQYANLSSRESYVFWITLAVAICFGFIPAVIVGFTAANMLFAKRMVNIKDATVRSVKNHDVNVSEFMTNKNGYSGSMGISRNLLDKIEVIQVTNALLLNIAEVTEEALSRKGRYPSVIIIYLKNVPYVDGEGLKALKRL